MSGMLRGIFGLGRDDDFERELRNISKEESSLHSRIKTRSIYASRALSLLFFSSSTLEVAAISYAVVKLRSSDYDWAERVLTILPILVLPGLVILCYWTIQRVAKMLDSKDQKRLERLQAQRQAKIDELKKRTNFYAAQQLIQRYDPDPMSQAAAASIFGSKPITSSDSQASGADETPPSQKSNVIESGRPTTGLRKIPGKGSENRDGESGGASDVNQSDVTPQNAGIEDEGFVNGQIIVDHYDCKAVIEDCGWIARIMSLLVSEDHTESCPLICGNCHKHNGLTMKEDFPSIMYYCPHCHALNRPKNMEKTTDVFSLYDKSPRGKDIVGDDESSRGKDIVGDAASGDSVTEDEDVIPSSSTSCTVEAKETASMETSLATLE